MFRKEARMKRGSKSGNSEHLHVTVPSDLSRKLDEYRRRLERPLSRPKTAVLLMRRALGSDRGEAVA
jgi:hypothetical protein